MRKWVFTEPRSFSDEGGVSFLLKSSNNNGHPPLAPARGLVARPEVLEEKDPVFQSAV